MYEDKQRILDLLLPALQATRNLWDLESLKYDAENELVIMSFPEGIKKKINVAKDSGTAMIIDILTWGV